MKAPTLLLVLAAIGLAHAAPADKTREYQSYVYKKVGDRELKLYVTDPPGWKATDKRPAVVYFHGGGWIAGKVNPLDDRARYLVSRGLVCVAVDYRLLDRKSDDPPTICIQDAKSAMRWVRGHAAMLGIDPNRIAASGGSAGGHLASFCGMVEGMDDPQDDLKISPKANALVLYRPVFDNGPDQGYGQKRIKDRYKEFSPAYNITPDDPPTIIFVGTKDGLVPVPVVKRFQANMQKAGVRCETVFFEGQKHSFPYSRAGGIYYYESLVATDKFLASLGWLQGEPTLKKPAADTLPQPQGGADNAAE